MSESEFEDADENPLVLPSFSTLNPKNGYLRMKHFEDEIKSYLGLKKIKNEVTEVFNPEKRTRQKIVEIMKLKGKENSFFFQITGKPVDDISHLEKNLLENFRLFSAVYDEEKCFGRKKFLKMNYVLFHQLKQLGHDVDESHFSLMKTEEIKKNHDEIIGKIFEKLKWN